MKASIARRLADLERRRENRSRQMHIIKATEQVDLNQQMTRLLESGAAGLQDGFLCLTGQP